jgi:Protein of unknown function (DUF4238)
LKGFTDDKDGFFIYDKQNDKIFRNSPSSTLFENNLNTIVSPQGTASDWLEDYYTAVENQVWGSFDTIRNSTNKTPIDLSDKMNLFFSAIPFRYPSGRLFLPSTLVEYSRY